MFLRVLYGLVALFVFCNAQVLKKKWDEDPENPNSWINIDSERNNDVDLPYAEYTEKDGSGSGMMVTDDDDLLQGSGSGSGLGGPSVTDEETDVDEPPRVNAGPDVILRWPQRTTVLCGNATTDDRGIAKFLWIKSSSSLSVTMSGVTGVCVSLSGLMIGEYTFTLQVTDSGGNKGTDQVRVVVEMGTTTTTVKPVDKTACQQLRYVSKHLLGSYVPRCTETGEFAGLQCRGHASTGSCWCADLDGAEIPGTNVSPTPDCELGTNLQPCVFKLVQQMRKKLLGTFQPKCSLDGDFEAVQCEGSSCFCVDQKTGVRVHGTEVFKPDQPECEGKRTIRPTSVASTVTTTSTITTSKTTAATKQWTTTRQPMVPKSTSLPDEDKEDDEEEEEVDEDVKEITTTQKPHTTESGPHREPSAAHMISQPGILAAIIGGSVVLLLCAILLVMFVVYRMRKKDEGSYALDEPKKMPNYSYQRAPDKEFYA